MNKSKERVKGEVDLTRRMSGKIENTFTQQENEEIKRKGFFHDFWIFSR